jgi:hypothetical protein
MKISEYVKQQNDWNVRHRPLNSENITWEETAGGVRPHLDIQDTSSFGSGDTYDGPFKVVKKDDTTVTIQGYNLDEDAYLKNEVYLGLQTVVFGGQDVDITVDGYVAIQITCDEEGVYTLTAVNVESFEQDEDNLYIPLARVKFADSKITSLTQIQYGQVFGAGRVF